MKKLLSVLLAVMFVMCSFAGCSERDIGYDVQDPSATKPEYLDKQSEIVGGLGGTQENIRIVGYKQHTEYYEYIAIKYNDEGIRVWERTYYVYYNMSYYANGKEAWKDAKNAEFIDEAAVIEFTTSFANTGLYSSDLAKVEKVYKLR